MRRRRHVAGPTRQTQGEPEGGLSSSLLLSSLILILVLSRYFTLSESDGSEGGREAGELPPSPRLSIYRQCRELHQPPARPSPPVEVAPPRPSPPRVKEEGRHLGEDLPPRPPPPLSYTSTLPPPVPKKLAGRCVTLHCCDNFQIKVHDDVMRFLKYTRKSCITDYTTVK